MSDKQINVVKRDGSKEPLQMEKFHRMVVEATEGLAGVSPSQVEINSNIHFVDGITSTEIQATLVYSAANLISLETPNYQYVAARLLLYGLRKDVYGQFDPVPLKDLINANIERGVYDPEFLEYYTEEEIDELDAMIKHDRDLKFAYSGLRQVVDKYLVQNRTTGDVYETPQYMYIMIAATLFSKYPKETRMKYIKRYYDAASQFKISLPTPIMGGVRTPTRQYASCVLTDVGDSLDSIYNTNTAIGRYIAQRAGIGINVGRIRGIGSQIRGGEVVHTGLIPFLKMYEATVRSCTQNGIRGGSATVNVPLWHYEIEDIIVLKNNRGSDDNRVRKLDYCIQLCHLFYKRFLQGGNITLFSPNDTPGLYDAFVSGNNEEFERLYIQYENTDGIRKKTVPAQRLITDLLRERFETGRMYLMNIDHANSHSSYLDPITMTNLCTEITIPTSEINHIDSTDGEIATCILSAVNLGKINNIDELENVCDLIVRSLDALIDYQNYPVEAARVATHARRSLGVGYIGLAHYLAKNRVKYSDKDAWELVDRTTEAFQYYLLKASNNLAKEQGPCSAFDRTKYSKGILPIDTYKKSVDELVEPNLQMDWESLRADILEYGLRNSSLTAQMPAESSAVVSNATNGIEMPRDLFSVKKSKKGTLPIIVPSYATLKNQYSLLWEQKDNSGYIAIVAIMQKYFDQAISGNWAYDPRMFEAETVTMQTIVKDFLDTYKYGWKTSYYVNTNDLKGEVEEETPTPNGAGAESSPEEDDDMCESCAI